MDCSHEWKDMVVSEDMDNPIQVCYKCKKFRFESIRDGWIEEIDGKAIGVSALIAMQQRRIFHFFFGDCGISRETLDFAVGSRKINEFALRYFKNNLPESLWHVSYLIRIMTISEDGCLFIYHKKEYSKIKWSMNNVINIG